MAICFGYHGLSIYLTSFGGSSGKPPNSEGFDRRCNTDNAPLLPCSSESQPAERPAPSSKLHRPRQCLPSAVNPGPLLSPPPVALSGGTASQRSEAVWQRTTSPVVWKFWKSMKIHGENMTILYHTTKNIQKLSRVSGISSWARQICLSRCHCNIHDLPWASGL